MASYKCCAHVFVDCSCIDESTGECAQLLGGAGGADPVGGLTEVLVKLHEPECWISGSGPPRGLRLRLRASGEAGDGVNIIQGRAGIPS